MFAAAAVPFQGSARWTTFWWSQMSLESDVHPLPFSLGSGGSGFLQVASSTGCLTICSVHSQFFSTCATHPLH
jgi:hypothetical protein